MGVLLAERQQNYRKVKESGGWQIGKSALKGESTRNTERREEVARDCVNILCNLCR